MRLMDGMSRLVGSLLVQERIDVEGLMAAHTPAQVSAFLSYRYFDKGRDLFINEDSVFFAVEYQPMTGAPEDLKTAMGALLGVQAPDECFCQVILHSSPRIGPILDRYVDARVNEVYADLARRRAEHLESGIWDSLSRSGKFMLRHHRSLFVCSMPLEEGQEEDTLKTLSDYLDQVKAVFRQMSTCYVMQPPELNSLVGEILNPSLTAKLFPETYSDLSEINRQCVFSDTSYTVYRDHIHVRSVNTDRIDSGEEGSLEDDMEIRVLEARQFPERVRFGDAFRMLGDGFARANGHSAPVTTILQIYFPHEESANGTANGKFMRAKQVAENPMSRYQPSALAKAADWEHAIKDMTNGSRPVKVALFAVVTSRKGEGSRAARDARAVFRSAHFDMRQADRMHLPTLLATLPGMAAARSGRDLLTMRRFHTQMSSTNVVLAPLFGEFLGTANLSNLYIGRLGQPFSHSVMASKGVGNMNGTCIGSSGSGKSFLLNDTILGHCGTGGHVVAIDDGRSFENHCKLVGGRHYTFDLKSEFRLGVFGMIKDECELPFDIDYGDYLGEAYQIAAGVFAQMCIGDRELAPSEKGLLMSAVQHVHQAHGKNGGANEVREFLTQQEDLRSLDVKSMVLAMAPYCGSGPYARIFNGPNTLELDSHFTCFELSPLETKPELRSVIVTCLFALIDSKITSDTSREDLIILDEAWKHLASPSLASVIEGWARRLRKYNAGVILGTQSYLDFSASLAARTVMENAEWMMMMKQKGSSVNAAAVDGVFRDAYGERLCSSLVMEKGEYSECMILCDRWYAAGRLVVDPYTALLYSTDGEVTAALRDLQARGLSVADSLSAYLEGQRG